MTIAIALYRLGTQAYFLLIRLAALFQPKAKLAVEGRRDWRQRLQAQLKDEPRPRIWLHCASLGEYEQGKPVLDALRQEYASHAFVLSFFSPSGYEVKKEVADADYVCYLPFDSPANAGHFISVVSPQLCLIVKYEYWYFLLRQLHRQSIPIFLIAPVFRRSQPFFQWYGALHRRMLHYVSHFFVQDVSSQELLHTLALTNTTVAGDPRFDQVLRVASERVSFPIADDFCSGSKILIAGSTWPEDESLLADALVTLPADWKLLLAPHEVDQRHIAVLQTRFGNEAILWSQWTAKAVQRVLIVDSVGMLSRLYRYGTIAWIGGGFGKAGIHNVLEAAVYGIPCLHGPVYHQFLEAGELLAAGSSMIVNSSKELVTLVQTLTQDNAASQRMGASARSYVLSKAGATDRIVSYLREKKSLSSL